MAKLLLDDPTHEEIIGAARKMLEAANKGCRSRTVAWSDDLAIACEAAADDNRPSGDVYQDDGGSVSNSYREVAATTSVFLAWGLIGGRRKVLISIGRVDARKQSRGVGPGVTRYRGTGREAVEGMRLPAQLQRA